MKNFLDNDADQSAESLREIKTHRENLEHLVDTRTVELKKTNEKLQSEITERKLAENRIAHLNRVLRAINNVNQLIVREKDPYKMLKEACAILVDTRGYHNIWIGLFDEQQKLSDIFESGLGKQFESLKKSIANGAIPECIKEAIGSSDIVITANPFRECEHCPLSQNYEGRGAMTIRLEHDGKVFGILCGSIPENLVNENEERILIREVAGDIAFALQNIELEKEREKTAQALLASEERYRITMSSLDEGLFDWDIPNNKMVFSPSYYTMLGYDVGEFAEDIESYQNLLHPDDRERSEKNLADLFNSDENYATSVLQMRAKNGSYRWILAHGKIVKRDDDGNPIRFVGTNKDITDHKNNIDALKVSESRFRQIYENVAIGIARVSLDFRIEAANNAYCAMLGYNEKELTGMHLKDITHSEIIEENLQKQKKLAKGEIDHYRMEKKFIHKNGETVYGILDANLIRNAEGKPIYFLGSVLDITDRLQTEAELKESEFKYRHLVENSLQGMVIAQDDPVRITYASKPMEEISGYSDVEFMNMNMEQLIGLIHEGDRERFFGNFKARIRGDKISPRSEYRIIHKDGTDRWVELFSSLIDWQGTPATQTIFLDITEIKRATDAIDKFFEQPMNIHIIAGFDGIIYRVNKGWETILGYSKEELEGKKFLDFVHPDDIQSTIGQMEKQTKGITIYKFENRYRHKDGSYRTLLWSSIGSYQDQRLYGVASEITERKQAEAKLLKYQQKLENMVHERTRELQTVVNAMSGREIRMSELKDVIKNLRQQLIDAGLKPEHDDPLNSDILKI